MLGLKNLDKPNWNEELYAIVDQTYRLVARLLRASRRGLVHYTDYD